MKYLKLIQDRLIRFYQDPKERPWVRWLSKGLWIGAISTVVISALIFILVSFSDLPGFEELENPQYDLASFI